MTFSLPPALSGEALRELTHTYAAGGPDQMPWPTAATVEPGRLTIRRAFDSSGPVQAPWDVPGLGRLMLTSATLIERPSAYVLPVELARGKVNQLRGQAAEWAASGLPVPDELCGRIAGASQAFARAVTRTDPDESARHGADALTQACHAAADLVRVYTDQVFQIRHLQHPRLDCGLGCRLEGGLPAAAAAAALLRACNSVSLPVPWARCEPAPGRHDWQALDALVSWAEAQSLAVTLGPVVDFTPAGLPAWLKTHDPTALTRAVTRFAEAALRRYRRRVRSWQLSAASNTVSLPGLAEDDLLLLTVRLLETARQVDPGLEVTVGLAQPWGEYLTRQERPYSPIEFADHLLRHGLMPAALDLEVVMAVSPGGTYCRDLLDVSRTLDLYGGLLGLPLHVTLGYPAAAGADPLAAAGLSAGAGHVEAGLTPQGQAAWARDVLSLVVAKPYVHAVQWAHLEDARPHVFPHVGLVDAAGQPRPVLDVLARLRAEHLT